MHRILVIFVWLWVMPAFAGGLPDGSETLNRLLSKLHSFNAEFSQTVFDINNEQIQVVEGQLKATRPNKLYWNTAAPMEQLIVADGEQIWVYDPDLEQVIVQGYPEELAKTPAMLLIGKTEALAEQYDVFIQQVEETPADDLSTANYILVPKSSQSLYSRLTLTLTDGLPSVMVLEDTLQQRTVIEFSAVVANQPAQPELFRFSLPEGVDLIRND